jgi:hypothetical protein
LSVALCRISEISIFHPFPVGSSKITNARQWGTDETDGTVEGEPFVSFVGGLRARRSGIPSVSAQALRRVAGFDEPPQAVTAAVDAQRASVKAAPQGACKSPRRIWAGAWQVAREGQQQRRPLTRVRQ